MADRRLISPPLELVATVAEKRSWASLPKSCRLHDDFCFLCRRLQTERTISGERETIVGAAEVMMTTGK